MAEAKGRADWGRTSATMALTANVNRDPKKTRAFRPADFNPYEMEKRTVGKAKDLSILKAVFVDERQAIRPSDCQAIKGKTSDLKA